MAYPQLGVFTQPPPEADAAESVFETRILRRDLETSRLLSIDP